jgi:hypothetical protein
MPLYKYLSLIILLFLVSCSSEKPLEVSGQKPVGPTVTEGSAYAMQITPINAYRNTQVYLVPQGFDLSNAKIEWLVNGSPVESPKPGQFSASEVKKGDTVQAKATIQGKEVFSNSIRIINSPPEIAKVKILPDAAQPGDTLSVDVEGKDADEDTVSFTYEWTRNEEPAGNGRQIEGQLRRGDKITLTIVPSDGEVTGRPIIVRREIKNIPPSILDNRKFSFDGKVYTFQVTANDPDGDTLTYSLQSAPKGMTINQSTGLVYWNVPAEFKGKAPFMVSVSDSQGGESRKSFTIEIKQPK